MNLKSVFLACAAALLVSVNSEAAYYSGLDVSYSISGSFGIYSDSKSGKSIVDVEDVLVVMAPGPKGIQITGKQELFKDNEDTVLGFVGSTVTGGGIGEEVGFSFSSTIVFTLDQAISATAYVAGAGYNSGPYAGTYTMTVNGSSVPFLEFTGVSLLEGLNTIVITGELAPTSLAYNLNESGGGYLIFNADPAPVPEPGSWALLAFGGGVALMVARRKLSQARA